MDKILGHYGEVLECRDGTPIQLSRSGNGNAPDKQGGQHTNMSTSWYRILKKTGADYQAVTEFLPLYGRGLHHYFELVQISDNPEEFQQLIEEM